jgi:hypothetical protein
MKQEGFNHARTGRFEIVMKASKGYCPWDMMSYDLLQRHQHDRGILCLRWIQYIPPTHWHLSPKLHGITPQKTVITTQKGLGTIKYHMGRCIFILLDLMLISHEVGEINCTLMHTNTFHKVDLKCFTIKKRDIEY